MDVAAISTTLAGLSILVGVVFAIFQMRDAARARHTELIIELNPALRISADDMSESLPVVLGRDYADFDDYVRKYGEPLGDKSFYVITEYFNGLGFLLHRRLIDIDEIDYLLSGTTSGIWEKVRPLVETMRVRYNVPGLGEWFEYLSERMAERDEARTAPS